MSLSMPLISSPPLGRVSSVSATVTDCLLPRNDYYCYLPCGSSLLRQWNRGALRSRSSLCSLNMSSSCPFGVLHMENLVACHDVNRLGRSGADCYHRVALCQSGIRCKEVFSRQTTADLKFRTSATGVTSVQKEEEIAGESTAPAEKSSAGKIKASGQLARWARARKIRAGKLVTVQKKNESIASVPVQEPPESGQVVERETGTEESEEGEEVEDDSFIPPPEGYEKCVYMVSDGTGWTADHSVHAALGQFEHCMVDRRCSVNTHLFSDVNDEDRLMQIVRQAGLEGGMIVFTLADPAMADIAKQACELLRIPHIDILGPITESLANHLGVTPLGLPRGAPGRKHALSKQYFKRIEAVEFTIKQDDGALPKNLMLADLVLVGVSRTSKTPLSTYIAQKGYKVANVPLVFGIDPPKELFQVDQDKVFGLTINANFLKAIRLARYRHLGVADNSRSSYSDMEHIRRELEYSRKLFSQNPRWPVVEVTGKAIEETAAVILRLYHERRNKYSMPRISTRY